MSIGQQVKMTGSIFSSICPFDRICIRVRYGIKSKELFFLKTQDLKQIKDGQFDFETKIKLFSSKLWSSSGKVLQFSVIKNLILRALPSAQTIPGTILFCTNPESYRGLLIRTKGCLGC